VSTHYQQAPPGARCAAACAARRDRPGRQGIHPAARPAALANRPAGERQTGCHRQGRPGVGPGRRAAGAGRGAAAQPAQAPDDVPQLAPAAGRRPPQRAGGPTPPGSTGRNDPHLRIRCPDGHARAKTSTITATDGHPFWVPRLHRWVEASNLTAGQWLQTSSGTWVQIKAVRHHTQQASVNNLTVEGLHTYYVLAGKTPILVHNADCGETTYYHGADVDSLLDILTTAPAFLRNIQSTGSRLSNSPGSAIDGRLGCTDRPARRLGHPCFRNRLAGRSGRGRIPTAGTYSRRRTERSDGRGILDCFRPRGCYGEGWKGIHHQGGLFRAARRKCARQGPRRILYSGLRVAPDGFPRLFQTTNPVYLSRRRGRGRWAGDGERSSAAQHIIRPEGSASPPPWRRSIALHPHNLP
jgi:hypothetical protein